MEGSPDGGHPDGGPDELVAFVTSHPRRATRQLAEAFGVGDEDFGGFRDRLLESQRQGSLLLVPGEGWDLPHRTPLRVGVLRVGRKGSGFVRVPFEDEDVFVRARSRQDAVSGDRVLVQLTTKGTGERLREGRVAGVVDRGRKLIRGAFRQLRKGGVVTPKDGSLDSDVYVPAGSERGVRDGDHVLVRLTDGSWRGRPRGEVAVGLQREGSLKTDLEVITAEFELPGPPPESAEDEARSFPDIQNGDSWPDREDVRGLVTFTIDPQDAKDFDDAISLERLPRGAVRLGVHIADVSHYVRPGSPLDQAAAARSTSIYLPGRVITMLPEKLANGLCSLRPREDRLAKSVFMTFSADAKLEKVEILRTVIHSRRRFTYEEVEAVLDKLEGKDAGPHPPTELPEDHAEYSETMEVMARLRDGLRRARQKRGALRLNIPRLKLELDSRGEVTGLGQASSDAAHELIEEFMLAANEAVARYLVEHRLPLVGRVHPAPNEEKLEAFRDLVKATGFRLRGASRSQDLQALVDDVVGSPLATAIQVGLLKTMGHAEYIPGSGLHFALATNHYCHFTSPIRRYPDLLVHQILDDHLMGRMGKAKKQWDTRLPVLAEQSSQLERRAEDAERAMIQLRLVRYLEPMLGQELDGWVISVHSFGFFVRAEDLLLEGLVHVATLGDDFYDFDEEKFALRGRRHGRAFRLGDRVRVVLSGLDPQAREISFQLVR